MAAARPMDRRVRRTRERLRAALVALMTERGYDRTTVQDILERADVGRTTFYAHFRNKDELLDSSIDALRVFLRAQQSEGTGDPLRFLSVMFEHAHQHRRLYRALVGRRSGAVVQRRIRRVLADLVRDELAPAARRGELSVPLELLVEHTVGGFFGVLTWWLDHRTGLSTAEIDEVFRRLAQPALDAAHRRARTR